MIRVNVFGDPAWYGNGGVEARDDGEWVVMIHGAGCDHSVWALQARQLARKGCRVVAVDLPRHGASSGYIVRAVGDFAYWLDALLGELSIDEPVTLVGHSMGACIATTYASKFANRVSRLIVLGAGNKMPVNKALLDDTLNRPQRAHAFIAAFGHGRATHFGRAATPGIWNLGATRSLLERCPPEVLHADFQACNAWRADGIAEKVRCPSLVIAGSADRMTPPRSAKALAAALPDAHLEIIDGAGHLMLSEAPDEISRLLVSFTQSEREEMTLSQTPL